MLGYSWLGILFTESDDVKMIHSKGKKIKTVEKLIGSACCGRAAGVEASIRRNPVEPGPHG